MLNHEDKVWLTNTIKEEIRKALTVKVKYEKRRDEKTGQKLSVPEIIEQDEYLPEWWIKYLPYYEGSNRGIQETMDKNDATTKQVLEGLKATYGILASMEKPIKQIAAGERKEIEYTPKSKLSKLENVINDSASSEAEINKAREQWLNITGDKYESYIR